MKFNSRKTVAILLATAFTAVSAPALADGDSLHYEQNRASYITHEKAAQIAVAKVGSGQATGWNLTAAATSPTILTWTCARQMGRNTKWKWMPKRARCCPAIWTIDGETAFQAALSGEAVG